MAKGVATRQAIVEAALRQAAHEGLASVTFGGLADELQLSKSGLFAHFQAKEALQLAVLREAGVRFQQRVLAPALGRRPGRERLSTLFTSYLDWMGDGCVYSAVAQEIDKLSEGVADAFRDGQRQWQQMIRDTAREAVGPRRASEVVLHFVGLALAYQQAVKVFADTSARRRVVQAFARTWERT